MGGLVDMLGGGRRGWRALDGCGWLRILDVYAWSSALNVQFLYIRDIWKSDVALSPAFGLGLKVLGKPRNS